MGALADFKSRWNSWSARFAALQPREKYLIIGAVVVTIVSGGDGVWITPGEAHKARLKKTLDQQLAEQTQLQTQVVTMASGMQIDPNAANLATLQQLRAQLADADKALRAFDQSLLAPTQAPAFLQTLVARHRGLKLLSLTTLAPRPLVERPKAPEGSKEAVDKAREAELAQAANIYLHGVEVKLSGSYPDLLAYVAELEGKPQKVLWGDLRLAVREYPVSELTLIVYTLSMERIWLVV